MTGALLIRPVVSVCVQDRKMPRALNFFLSKFHMCMLESRITCISRPIRKLLFKYLPLLKPESKFVCGFLKFD